jgi:hypothetical protein
MRWLTLLALLTLIPLAAWSAEEPSSAIAAFNAAMGGQDAVAKKKAVQGLVAKDAGSDDVVLPLLIQALGDRQVGDQALTALRSRTGLQAPTNKRVGGPGYPGYPADDSAGSWSAWLAARTKALEQEKLLKAMKDNDKPKEQPKKGDEQPAGETIVVKPKPTQSDPDLGSMDRVILKTGGALLCYVLSKRTDADGNLISVRIAHPDGGGEEVLQADLIARLEEDVK